MGLTVLVFDMDDTLYPEKEFVRLAFMSLSDEVEASQGIANFGIHAWKLFEAGNRGNLFQLVFNLLCLENISSEYLDKLLNLYRDHQPEVLPWFPDAKEFFEKYHSLMPFSIITDGYLPTQRNKVKALGLESWASPIVCSEELGREYWKPSPMPYLKVTERFPEGSKFIYIADNPIKDFISPKEMSWGTVRVRREGTEHYNKESTPDQAPDIEIANFSELRESLEKLCPKGSLIF